MRRSGRLFSYIVGFLAAASFVPLFAVYQNDRDVKGENKEFAGALLELKKFKYVELQNGSNGVEVLGSVGYHFKDKDEIYGFKIEKRDVNYTTNILSKKAVKIGDEITLTGDVNYLRSDGYKITTDKSRYKESIQTLYIDNPFRFEGEKFVAFGNSSSINIKNKTVGIESVRAKLNL